MGLKTEKTKKEKCAIDLMKRELAKGRLLENIDLKPFTSWHIGGSAEHFYWPEQLDDLVTFIKTIPAHEAITWLGLGSNTLVSDQGVAGTVIITQGALKSLSLLEDNIVKAEAGVSCAQVARFAARNNLVNGEFLAGIPGTVGGALYMNAGAFGGETWNHVAYVEILTRKGAIIRRPREAFHYGYRFIEGLASNEWFSAAYFKFNSGDGAAGLEQIKKLLTQRGETQPTGEPSCGSVFRNPPGNFAAKLIEACGLKGFRIGGAEISPKHANFIINMGDASAKDVLNLVSHTQKIVTEKFGLTLLPEMKFIGRR